MTLAAPAVAIANQSSKNLGHTAPLLPTPPPVITLSATNTTGAGLAGVAPGIPAPVSAVPTSSVVSTTVCYCDYILMAYHIVFCGE
jgi:hypothetical protein